MDSLKCVGKPASRIDELDKITGAATFVEDINFGPDLLYAAIVESPYAHALIIKIDVSRASKIPGVVKVVTGKEFPHKFGLYMKDRYVFAQDRVRFAGEQVAAVIAQDPKTAFRAAKLVKVDYKPLKPILSPSDALKDKSQLIHPGLGKYKHVPWFFPKGGTNIAHWRKIRKGDLKKGFKEADFILEDTYKVPRYSHCAIEVHGAVGLCDPAGRITVWTSSQSPYTQRNLFAEALDVSHKDVRVITPYVGGGFGGKAGVTMEILAPALATQVKGHPVKVLWSREQEFYNTYQRLGIHNRIKLGVKKNGLITALDNELIWDAGAYVEYGANVVNATGLSSTGPYRIDNVKIDSVCMYTNLPPGGPYRGFGYSEMLFGLESHINRISKEIGVDPVVFRKRNGIKKGDKLVYGAKMNPSGLHKAIDKVSKEIQWGKKAVPSKNPNKKIGKGFALCWKGPAMPPNASSCSFLKFNEDASINIMISAMEIGQGLLTVMAQIASEILSVPVSKIRVETPDTDRNPYEWQTVASHITWGCGNAVKNAALDAREQIFNLIQRVYHYKKQDLYLENEHVRYKKNPKFKLSLKQFVIEGLMMKDGTFRGGPIIGRGMFMPEFSSALSDPKTSQGGKPNVHYTVGAAGVELEVDIKTGKIKILKISEALDAGKAINPDLVKAQISGGILQGIATALYEDMRYDKNGKLLNPNFTDYKIPTFLEAPDKVVPIIIEVPQPDGPFGARGIGEHPMIPIAPMIANAVEDALGIRIKSMPLTAEKIALAVKNKKKIIE